MGSQHFRRMAKQSYRITTLKFIVQALSDTITESFSLHRRIRAVIQLEMALLKRRPSISESSLQPFQYLYAQRSRQLRDEVEAQNRILNEVHALVLETRAAQLLIQTKKSRAMALRISEEALKEKNAKEAQKYANILGLRIKPVWLWSIITGWEWNHRMQTMTLPLQKYLRGPDAPGGKAKLGRGGRMMVEYNDAQKTRKYFWQISKQEQDQEPNLSQAVALVLWAERLRMENDVYASTVLVPGRIIDGWGQVRKYAEGFRSREEAKYCQLMLRDLSKEFGEEAMVGRRKRKKQRKKSRKEIAAEGSSSAEEASKLVEIEEEWETVRDRSKDVRVRKDNVGQPRLAF